MKHFVIKYYRTKEHYKSDAWDSLDDKFYSESGYINKAQDLMYRHFHYRVEVYSSNDMFQIIRAFKLEDFNREQYKNFKL
tara:strand:- start:34029 stop:34268 length:240 start_codon:yes stop_codon:yes gene_type:complete